MNTDTITRECGKCSGTGRINAFSHIAGGVCFACGGVGHFVTTVAKERRREAAAARRAAKAEQDREEWILARMRERKAAGWTLQEYHDSVCHCGGNCTAKFGVDKKWESV